MFSVLSGRKPLASSPVLKTAQLLLSLTYSESIFLPSDLSLPYRNESNTACPLYCSYNDQINSLPFTATFFKK